MSPDNRRRTVGQNSDSKKTFVLGLLIVVILVLIVFFGFSFLISFSAFLGGSKKATNSNNDDSLPPLPPRIFIPFEATNSAVLNVSGTAETGTLIELSKDDVLLDTMDVDEDGDFEFENVLLERGDNTFSAVAVAPNGKRSDFSKEVSIVFDDEQPSLKMTNPSEETLTVDYADFDVTGIAEADASVTINGKIALVDSEGNFKLKFQLSPGKNDIEIKVRDMAGNETTKKITIEYDY